MRESRRDNILSYPTPHECFSRFIAVMLCVCLTVAFALFAVLALSHANNGHDHDGVDGGCLACAQIAATQSLLWGIDSLARCAIFSSCAIFIVLCNQKTVFQRAYFHTLTTLKIQLNN
jgi:hypothetical protein